MGADVGMRGDAPDVCVPGGGRGVFVCEWMLILMSTYILWYIQIINNKPVAKIHNLLTLNSG